jgi:hypothetical protein
MALTVTGNQTPTVVSGTYSGTTASQTITIGFAPSWIIGWNVTDGDTMFFWHTSSQTTYVKMVAAAASVTAAILPVAHGFTLATSDSIANEDGITFVFIAGR